jgi:hypothetical protein
LQVPPGPKGRNNAGSHSAAGSHPAQEYRLRANERTPEMALALMSQTRGSVCRCAWRGRAARGV